jgi:hypothetical protein
LEVPFYWSWCLFLFLIFSFHHFVFYLVPWCPLLVSLPFISYLTNKDLGQRRLHFTGQITWLFYFVPSCHVLVSLPFISYLTNKHLVQRRFHFTSQGTCFLNFIPSGHVLVYLPFISYLTTRTWGIRGSILLVMVLVFISSSLFTHFLFLLGSFVSSFGFSTLHLIFNKQGLGA